ncbi:3-oxoacyl-[acyl-carrier-protein] reductase [Desulforegula conservatrix]|uniref:3-oxoacyl-[acyl-carrier-protein] reductase n=1 Tax=Desulforegula conservatrix TaxID=153026 RepID=UPI000429CD06|nr:3-oxoacyl-[acyl-carrier-protein] reductase [Desulforegula conservatrix]
MTPRVVVVTGGSRGIGRSICLAFADENTHIFLNYSASVENAAETVRMIEEKGGKATAIKADVSSDDEVEAFFGQALELCGRIDVLVNNAGVTKDGLIARMKTTDWDSVIDTNLKGAFLCIRAVVRPMMKQRDGRIINITSIAGVAGNPGQANYAASKGGLIALTKSAARELASRNITVNAVAPGYIETDMTAGLNDQVKSGMLAQIPLGRCGRPEDVAAAVHFLASGPASYITGQVIHVNGGMYI